MNKGLTLLVILLLGLAASQETMGKKKNLADISTSQETISYYEYYYYNYSWIYYVSSAIFFCVIVFVVVRQCCYRPSRQIIASSTTPLVQNAYMGNQQYVPNQPYNNQQYTGTNQPYQSNMNMPNQQQQYYQPVQNVAPSCTICQQPLGVQNMSDPMISATMILQCSHSFHYGCISNVMKTQNKCPVCQMVIQQPQINKPQQDFGLQGEVPLSLDDRY